MFCKTCGQEVNDKAIICPSCGCKVNESEELAPTKVIANKKINICCLLGFILALVSLLLALWGTVAIAGLVLSIVGLVQCSKGGYKLKGLGIAGVVVAVCSLIYTVYVLVAAMTILSMF